MTQRSLRERVLQTLCFEAIGIVCVTPWFMWVYGAEGRQSFLLIAAISMIVVVWAPLYGWFFDWCEAQHTDRVASDRPHRIRLVHAVLYETSSITITLPMAMSLGGLSLTEAFSLNVGLTIFYIFYAYVFFLTYDRLRPIGTRHATGLPGLATV